MTNVRKLVRETLHSCLETIEDGPKELPVGRQWVNGIGTLECKLERLYEEVYSAGFQAGKADAQPKIDMLLNQLVEKST